MTDKNNPKTELHPEAIESLTHAVQRWNYLNTAWPSFWRGVMVGLGATLGVAAILWLAGWVLGRLYFIPGIDRVTNVIENVTDPR